MGIADWTLPTPAAQTCQGDPPGGEPPIRQHEEGRNVPVQMPCKQPGMRHSRNSHGREVQPSLVHIEEIDLAEEPHVAVAGRPNLPAQLAPASGMLERQGGRHSDEEVCSSKKKLAGGPRTVVD